MISLNELYVKLIPSTLYAKKEKDIIYASKLRNIIEIVLNNIFMMFVIFENNIVNIQLNSILYVAKVLVFKNYVLNMTKCQSSIYHKINNLKLTLFKIILIFL